MKPPTVILALMALALTSFVWAADPPELVNYQGVLRDASDKPLGVPDPVELPMTFRFFDASTGGNEILVDTHGAVTVSGGLFNIELGSGTVTDGSGPGSFTTLAHVFGQHTDLYLEVEVSGETLSPRTPVATAGYALNARRVRGVEIVSDGPLDLYVDAVMGDDSNDGLTWDTAKETINAAIDDIPMVIQGDVTVNVAAGTYSEEVLVWPRVRRGGLFGIRLIGDSTSGNAILDGDESGSPLQMGVGSLDPFVEVRWMTIRDYAQNGLIAVHGGSLDVLDCVITNNHLGIQAEHAGVVTVKDTQISSPAASGNVALTASYRGWIRLDDNVSIFNDPLTADANSTISFQGGSCTLSNVSMTPSDHSTIRGYGSCGGNYLCTPGDPSGRCVP